MVVSLTASQRKDQGNKRNANARQNKRMASRVSPWQASALAPPPPLPPLAPAAFAGGKCASLARRTVGSGCRCCRGDLCPTSGPSGPPGAELSRWRCEAPLPFPAQRMVMAVIMNISSTSSL